MTVEEYLNQVPADRNSQFRRLRDCIVQALPEGFHEEMNSGMIGYVVPHSLYPPGYHVNPALPLPFMNIASQTNSINFYHMGIYGDPELAEWFIGAWRAASRHQPDHAKSCFRFKYYTEIPYQAISELVAKISVRDWIARYESARNR